MGDDQARESHPALAQARYGKRRSGDQFLGFWLALMIEGRQYRSRRDGRGARRILDRFYAGREVRAAVDAVGVDVLDAELRDAAAVYFGTCLTDPQYSSGVWRMSRLTPDQIHAKAARDVADTLAVMLESGGLAGLAAHLPLLLTDGFIDAFGPDSAAVLRAAVAKNPAAVRALA